MISYLDYNFLKIYLLLAPWLGFVASLVLNLCGDIFPKLWRLRRHQERKFLCKPAPNPQLPGPIPNHEAVPGPATQAYREREAIVPSNKNPAYTFNKCQDNSIDYADAPYLPQLMGSARGAITKVLKEDGDPSNIENYSASYHHPYHRGNQHLLLSKSDIDEYITRSAGEIDKKIETYLREESGKILLRLEIVFIEAYTYRRSLGGSYIPTPMRLVSRRELIK
ncbi:9247_t:CDS:2, partial [Ambispora leptoticha]